MSDRTSHIYEGIASDLVTTYSASNTEETSSGYSCEKYERINVYLTVSTINSAGIAALYCEFSHDGTSWFRPQKPTTGTDNNNVDDFAAKIDEAIGYYIVFPNAGKFFRLRMTYVSGTSVVVSACVVEGKS